MVYGLFVVLSKFALRGSANLRYIASLLLSLRGSPEATAAIRLPLRSRRCSGSIYLYPTRRPSMYVFPYGKTGRPVDKASYQPLSSLQGSEIPPHPFRLRLKAKIPKMGGGSGLDKSLRRQGQQEV